MKTRLAMVLIWVLCALAAAVGLVWMALATLTIGGISDVWYVTTRNAPIPQIIFL